MLERIQSHPGLHAACPCFYEMPTGVNALGGEVLCSPGAWEAVAPDIIQFSQFCSPLIINLQLPAVTRTPAAAPPRPTSSLSPRREVALMLIPSRGACRRAEFHGGSNTCGVGITYIANLGSSSAPAVQAPPQWHEGRGPIPGDCAAWVSLSLTPTQNPPNPTENRRSSVQRPPLPQKILEPISK